MSKPWITKGLYVSIRYKQSLYKTHFKSNNIEKIIFFKKYSNKLTHLKSICKKRYFHEQISNNPNNPNLVWKALKFILPSVKSNDDSTINLKVNGKYYNNQMKLQNISMTFLLTSDKNWQIKSLLLKLHNVNLFLMIK